MKYTWLITFFVVMMIMTIALLCGFTSAASKLCVPTYEVVSAQVIASYNGNITVIAEGYSSLLEFKSETDFKASQKLQLLINEDQDVVAALWDN